MTARHMPLHTLLTLLWCYVCALVLSSNSGVAFAQPTTTTADVSSDGSITTTSDGTACYSGCSGHGSCREFTCYCQPGFTGEDCGIALAPDERIVPLLTAGHFNVTAAGLKRRVKATRTGSTPADQLLVIGFSAYACDKCVVVESAYEDAAAELKALDVPFGRMAVNGKTKSILNDVGVVSLPALVVYRKGVPRVYTGRHKAPAIVAHVRKLLDAPAPSIAAPVDLLARLQDLQTQSLQQPFTLALGVFTASDRDTDEYDEFTDAAAQLYTEPDVHFGMAGPALRTWAMKHKWTKKTPSLVLLRVGYATPGSCDPDDDNDDDNDDPDGVVCGLDRLGYDRRVLLLEEYFDISVTLKDWLLRNSVPPIAALTPHNYPVYEAIGLPMVILFIDTREFVGGEPRVSKTGDVSNERLLQTYSDVARDSHFANKLVFVYTDGYAHADRMVSLGLSGDPADLPALAMNVRDGRRLPFPASLSVDETNLQRFCNDFLMGRLPWTEKDLKAHSTKQKQQQPRHQDTKGVLENWAPQDASVVPVVAASNFSQLVLDETRDVVLLLMAADSKSSMAMTPYYRRVGLRFQELGIDTVRVARMDVLQSLPPVDLMIETLPMLVMFPAYDKEPPFRYYSGVSKVGPMMRWVADNAGRAMDLPDLPQFNDQDKELFKEQITDRENRRKQTGGAGGRKQGGKKATTKKKKAKKGKATKHKKSKNKQKKTNAPTTANTDHRRRTKVNTAHQS